MASRTRLSPEDRREQLLDMGSQLFASRPYDEVWIEEIAERAKVSRGLLYHYFPTKRAFFAAMLRRETARMIDLTAPDPSADLLTQLTAGVDAYLAYCEAHAQGIRLIYSGALSSDPEVQAIINQDLAYQEGRIIAAISPDREPHQLVRIAVRSWLTFLRTACHEWLNAVDISRDKIRDLCVNSLISTLRAIPEHARPPVLPHLP